MGTTLRTAREVLRAVLSSAGRDRRRRLYAAETEALVTAHRMQLLRELACLSEYHLGLTDLARRDAVASQPDVHGSGVDGAAQAVVEEFGRSMQRALADYSAGRPGPRLSGGTAW